METINSFLHIGWRYWKTALGWLLFSLAFGLLPTWISIIMLKLFKYEIGFPCTTDNGEFALYAASMVSTGLYFIGKDFIRTSFPGRMVFLSIFGLILVTASLLFGGVCVAKAAQLPIDMAILRIISIGTWVISIPLVFIVSAINEFNSAQDLTELQNQQQNNLEERFDETGGQHEH